MKALSLATSLSIFLSTSAAMAAPGAIDATAADVSSCTFVLNVNGRSVFGERLKEQGAIHAKEEARAVATQAGGHARGLGQDHSG